ncbi:MAG: 16S rRNA (guanine(966)-N(2))-methyltransferase RsmD [Candidatus Omnitrophica bacterium]|nr:16S rRNA (guanine(966)-N(2))-methyltransferase RsmD [Candidatus Omnitrophota bacterium]
MHILAGIAKGRKIDIPKGIHPTTQKIKEAIFAILADKIKKAEVLELFAGSGSLGIEAISRESKKVIFIDNNFACVNAIRENLGKLGFLDLAQIKYLDFEKAIALFARRKERFDIIFADPPYCQKLGIKTLQKVSHADILFSDGLLVIEHYKKEILPSKAGNLILKQEKKYGDTILSLYSFKPDSLNL